MRAAGKHFPKEQYSNLWGSRRIWDRRHCTVDWKFSQGTPTPTPPDQSAAGACISVARSETWQGCNRLTHSWWSFSISKLNYRFSQKCGKRKNYCTTKLLTCSTTQKKRIHRHQVKEKGIKFQTRHPAKLLVHLESGPQVFHLAWEAAEALRLLGIQTNLSEWEKLVREQHRIGWRTAGRDRAAARRHKGFRDAEMLKKATSSD